MPRQVYWDSCVFIGLLNGEPGKVNDCRAVWDEAAQGKTTIVTSTFTYAEVFRAKCEKGLTKPLLDVEDQKIEDLLSQKWIKRILVDEAIGKAARRLLRAHPECKKPTDGIHLATALRVSVDEMHTYDNSDLLKLDGNIQKHDSRYLRICRPAPVPGPAPLSLLPSQQQPLLLAFDSEDK